MPDKKSRFGEIPGRIIDPPSAFGKNLEIVVVQFYRDLSSLIGITLDETALIHKKKKKPFGLFYFYTQLRYRITAGRQINGQNILRTQSQLGKIAAVDLEFEIRHAIAIIDLRMLRKSIDPFGDAGYRFFLEGMTDDFIVQDIPDLSL